MTRGIGLSALGLALLLSMPAGAQDKRPMTFDDLMALKNVSGTQISPDGRTVLYTLSYADLKENESRSEIWVVSAAGGKARRFTTGKKDRAPQWSPDGQWIAFLSERETAKPGASGLAAREPDEGPRAACAQRAGAGALHGPAQEQRARATRFLSA